MCITLNKKGMDCVFVRGGGICSSLKQIVITLPDEFEVGEVNWTGLWAKLNAITIKTFDSHISLP